MTEDRRLWHYTIGQRIDSIIEDGMIKLATAFVPQNERPVVWCSFSPKWEETANKTYVKLGREYFPDTTEMERIGGGCSESRFAQRRHRTTCSNGKS